MEKKNLGQRNMISSKKIYLDMCDKIEHLVYEPGQEISEKELCEQYGSSRHMVRTALAKLRDRKLVEIYPHRGTFVSLIDLDYIESIMFIREAVEQETVRRLIEMKDIRPLYHALQANLRQQGEALLGTITPTDEYFALDAQFHDLMREYAGVSSGIMDIISDPYIHFRRWRNLELRHTVRSLELLSQHREIVDCIASKDLEKAHKLVHNHINSISYYDSFMAKDKEQYFTH